MGYIQFVADHDDWKAVKKLNITKEVPESDILDFLASVSISFDSKMEAVIRKVTKLDSLDSAIKEISPGKVKKEDDFAKILKELASPKISKIINEIIPAELDNKSKDKLKIYLKIYANRKALDNAGLIIDYTKIPLPINKGK